ncbi:MAG: hypothetical protein HY553_12030 [Elusimicrobia bacterium]|nr:hypothetical protein [Elusimicrobiota bacterium]
MSAPAPEVLEERIVAALHKRDWAAAAHDAATLLDARPEHGLAGYALAVATYRTGRLSEAIFAAERAIAIKPTAALYTLAGDIHMAAGRLNEAGREWMSAREREPGGEAAAKLSTLMFYIRPGPHTRVIPRIGWRLGYLGCLVRLAGQINGKLRTELRAVGEALDEELQSLTGKAWPYFADQALHDAWAAALDGSDIEALGDAGEALLDATRASLEDHLPLPSRRWLEWGHGLCWAQALGATAEEELQRGGRPDLAGWHRLTVRFASQIPSDAEFLRRHPSFASLADRFRDFCAAPCSRESLEVADRLIEDFRAAAFR